MKKEEITIIKGSLDYLDDCEEALRKSALGDRYFSGEGTARKAVLEGMGQEYFYVALADRECVGFFYIIPNGAFHGFPYLHLIAIKEEYRGRGMGAVLLQRAEEVAFQMADKLFLVVADFNPDGKRFYERNGFRQVGDIPDLYRPGITEYLMMKTYNCDNAD